MRLVGLGLCVPGLMFVGLLAALEGWYRMTLRELPSLPTPPDATDRLPENLARVRWSVFESDASMTVEPVWPWTAVATVTRVLTAKPGGRHWDSGWKLVDVVVMKWNRDDSRPLRREGRLALAIWLTRHWSAEELLAYEGQNVFLGHGIRTLSEGSLRYLGKAASDLTLADAALLVTLNDQRRQTWRDHPECFVTQLQPRRDGLLHRMRESGMLTPAEEAAARAQPVILEAPGLEPHPCPP